MSIYAVARLVLPFHGFSTWLYVSEPYYHTLPRRATRVNELMTLRYDKTNTLLAGEHC